jgi:pimeloyl-ACP methyl ester carboxylesterase
MPVFEGQGLKLYYEDQGAGQPVVFVHGTVCDCRAWFAQTDFLSSDFRTIAYSRRYAQPNVRKGDIMDSTVQNNAADLEVLIKGMGLDKVHLVGHSYGGFIAAYFATKHPELLRSLVLVNPAVFTMIASGRSAASSFSLLLKSPSVALSARRLINAVEATVKAVDGGDKSAAEKIFVQAVQDGRTGLPAKPKGFSEMVAENAGTLKETTAPFPQLTALEARNIKTPTLVVRGELSAPWDLRISELLSSSIPSAEGAVIAGAGHFCLMEKPADVNEWLKKFLQRHR